MSKIVEFGQKTQGILGINKCYAYTVAKPGTILT